MRRGVKHFRMLNGGFRRVPGRILIAAAFCAVGSGPAFARGAPQLVEEGNAAFKEGSLAEAAVRYEGAREENPDSPVPLFNLGVVLYAQGNFPAALTAFQNIEPVSDELAPLIHYNQGNALARIGKMEESENPREALEDYRRSIAAYKRVLAIDPGNKESAYNIEVVRIWISDLEKQLEKTSSAGSSPRSTPSDANGEKQKASPGEQPQGSPDGQSGENDGGDAYTPPSMPSIPQYENTVPRDETAQGILREEQQRREEEARVRGGWRADEKPTW
jgi:hypothetical protein